MNENPNALQNVPGDGSPRDVEADELGQIREEMRLLATQGNYLAAQRNVDGQTRFAIWDGQSDDGRKWKATMGDRAFPYDGAPDYRDRTADMTVRKLTAKLSQAAARATTDFVVEPGSADTATLTAEKASAILDWIKKQWGRAFHREIRKGANYFLDDAPAGVVWYAGWRREQSIRMRRVTLDEFPDWFLDTFSADPAEQAEVATGVHNESAGGQHEEAHDPAELEMLRQIMLNPAMEKDAIDLLRVVMPSTVSAKALQRMVGELRKNGVTEFPEVYTACNQPILWALRLFEDVFVPVNTVRDIQNARVVYIREWLTASQVHEYALREGWDSNFVDKLLSKPSEQSAMMGGGCAGMSGLPVPWGTVQQAQTPLAQTMGVYRDFRHLYEVCRAYTRSINSSGVPGIYVTTFSYFVDIAAKPRELYRSGHGKMPFVWEQRESVNNLLTDSRSVSFISQTDQLLQKMYIDLKAAKAQLAELPPLEAGPTVQDNQVAIRPLALNKRGRAGDLKFMEFPQDRTSTDVIELIDKRHREYWGLAGRDLDPAEGAILQQQDIDTFLTSLSDALVMVMQDAQVFLEDDQVSRIVGHNQLPIGKDLDDIQGQFSLTMHMDTLDFNIELLTKFMEMFFKYVLPLDVGQTIDRAAATRWILNKLSPAMARATVLPAETANQRELDDEDMAISKALHGIESPLMADGQNHKARLDRLKQVLSKPDMVQRVMSAPDAQAILERRVAVHQQQVTQEDNKVIGRIGAIPEDMKQTA